MGILLCFSERDGGRSQFFDHIFTIKKWIIHVNWYKLLHRAPLKWRKYRMQTSDWSVFCLTGCLVQPAVYETQRHSKHWDIWQGGLSLWPEAPALVRGRLDVDRSSPAAEVPVQIPECQLTSSHWHLTFGCPGNEPRAIYSQEIKIKCHQSSDWSTVSPTRKYVRRWICVPCLRPFVLRVHKWECYGVNKIYRIHNEGAGRKILTAFWSIMLFFFLVVSPDNNNIVNCRS